MLLNRFQYFFSVTGDEGGLFSVDFDFFPTANGGASPKESELKEIIRSDFSGIEALLDATMLGGKRSLFGGSRAEKSPTLRDSEGSSTVGFRYVRDKRLTFGGGNATVEYNLSKDSRNMRAMVRLKLELDHESNLALFEEVMALPDLYLSDDAQDSIRQMKAVIAAREQKQTDPISFLENSNL